MASILDSLQHKFVKALCEGQRKSEIRDCEFNWGRIRNLSGFPKKEKIEDLQLCLISSNFVLLKGDDDILITIKDDGSDLYVESWEVVEAIFLPTLDDEDALEYFAECCIDIVFEQDDLDF